jgi:hypothetical protein
MAYAYSPRHKRASSASKFDKKLDEELWCARTEPGKLLHDNVIAVRVVSYNKGVPKIQIDRETGRQERLKLGRMTAQEMAFAIPLLEKAVEQIKEVFGEVELSSKPMWDGRMEQEIVASLKPKDKEVGK